MSNMVPADTSRFRIHHTMLPVSDLDRSIDFYTRLLGMQTMGRHTNQTRRVEVGHVGYGERETQPSLELTRDISENAPREVRPTGIHVAIHVNNLHQLCALLDSDGVTFLQALKESAKGKGRLSAWIRDPDGHAIELVETPSP